MSVIEANVAKTSPRPRSTALGRLGARLNQRDGDPTSFLTSQLNDSPWYVRDFTRLATRWGLGVIALVVCFVGCNNTEVWRTQLLWIVGGAVALVWMFTANASWLLTGLGVVARERVALRRAIVRHLEIDLHQNDSRGAERASAAGPDDAALVLTGDLMTRFHRPGCQLAAGKDLESVSRDVGLERGLGPCGVCSP